METKCFHLVGNSCVGGFMNLLKATRCSWLASKASYEPTMKMKLKMERKSRWCVDENENGVRVTLTMSINRSWCEPSMQIESMEMVFVLVKSVPNDAWSYCVNIATQTVYCPFNMLQLWFHSWTKSECVWLVCWCQRTCAPPFAATNTNFSSNSCIFHANAVTFG